MSATFELGYHPLEYIPCIVQPIPLSPQQQPTPQEQQHIDQEKKDQLIQAATSRLRQKLLEHKYQKLMSDIVEIQSKLDIVKLEASISLQSMDNHLHLDHFEKRLENHKLQLQSIIMASITSSSPYPKREMMVLNNRSISSSLSSFSSTISSVLSSFTDKDVEEESEPEDYFAILGHGSNSQKKRRKRQKMTQHNTVVYDIDSHASSSASDRSHDSNHLVDNNITPITSNANSSVVTSCCNGHVKYDESDSDVSTPFLNVKNKVVVPEIGRKGLLVLHSIHQENNGLIKQEDKEERNALDDTLSFLNDLASDSDDGGFREDIIQLLDTMHYSNHCQPEMPSCRSISSCSSFSASKSNLLYRPAPPYHSPFIHSSYSHRRRGFLKSTFYSILNTSWKWIRFALVLTLAISINLRRGPSF